MPALWQVVRGWGNKGVFLLAQVKDKSSLGAQHNVHSTMYCVCQNSMSLIVMYISSHDHAHASSCSLIMHTNHMIIIWGGGRGFCMHRPRLKGAPRIKLVWKNQTSALFPEYVPRNSKLIAEDLFNEKINNHYHSGHFTIATHLPLQSVTVCFRKHSANAGQQWSQQVWLVLSWNGVCSQENPLHHSRIVGDISCAPDFTAQWSLAFPGCTVF